MNTIPTFEALSNSLSDPHKLHALTVHFPIAIAVIGLPLVFLLIINRGKNGWLRWAVVGLYVLALAVSVVAKESGEDAEDRIDLFVVSEVAVEQLGIHHELGEAVPLVLLPVPILLALTAIRKSKVRWAFLVLSLLASIGASGFIGITAYHGGALVYEHGMGVPATQIEPLYETD